MPTPDLRPVDREVACFATQGSGSLDEQRIVTLLEGSGPTVLAFDRGRKAAMPLMLLREAQRHPRRLTVMEGTGLAGGLGVLLARGVLGRPFVVSTGDAVGPFLAGRRPALRIPAALYERLLYRWSAGVIAWSPYLAGRALTLGARRAMTAAHFAREAREPADGAAVRGRLGIPAEAMVFGLVGSLSDNPRLGYTYGAELVRALRQTTREDLRVLVVGGGSGLQRLRELAGGDERVLLPGPCPPDEVPAHLAAMDVGSLPQSIDLVGTMRYTTKLPEYLAARVPIVTGQLPLAYDLDEGWMWRLPGDAPWAERYVTSLARLMEAVDVQETRRRSEAVPADPGPFDLASQRRRVAAFIDDVLEDAT